MSMALPGHMATCLTLLLLALVVAQTRCDGVEMKSSGEPRKLHSDSASDKPSSGAVRQGGTNFFTIGSYLYDASVMIGRWVYTMAGTLGPQIEDFGDQAMKVPSSKTWAKYKDIDPGNFDHVHVNYSFYFYCPADNVPQQYWQEIAPDQAEMNRQNGYKLIYFCSRRILPQDPCINISGWYLPAHQANQPTIVFIAGSGAVALTNVVPGSWARNRLGYNVLMMDVRNHGYSQTTTGYRSWGLAEPLDVLGAIDCLHVGCQGTSPTPSRQIGLHGMSAGAFVGYQAFMLDEEIPGLWTSSGVFSLSYLVEERARVPAESAEGADLLPQWVGHWYKDVMWQPLMQYLHEKAGTDERYFPEHFVVPVNFKKSRSIFLAHATGDVRVPDTQTKLAEQVLLKRGYTVQKWQPRTPELSRVRCPYGDVKDYTSHVDSKYLDPFGYQQNQKKYWKEVFNPIGDRVPDFDDNPKWNKAPAVHTDAEP